MRAMSWSFRVRVLLLLHLVATSSARVDIYLPACQQTCHALSSSCECKSVYTWPLPSGVDLLSLRMQYDPEIIDVRFQHLDEKGQFVDFPESRIKARSLRDGTDQAIAVSSPGSDFRTIFTLRNAAITAVVSLTCYVGFKVIKWAFKKSPTRSDGENAISKGPSSVVVSQKASPTNGVQEECRHKLSVIVDLASCVIFDNKVYLLGLPKECSCVRLWNGAFVAVSGMGGAAIVTGLEALDKAMRVELYLNSGSFCSQCSPEKMQLMCKSVMNDPADQDVELRQLKPIEAPIVPIDVKGIHFERFAETLRINDIPKDAHCLLVDLGKGNVLQMQATKDKEVFTGASKDARVFVLRANEKCELCPLAQIVPCTINVDMLPFTSPLLLPKPTDNGDFDV